MAPGSALNQRKSEARAMGPHVSADGGDTLHFQPDVHLARCRLGKDARSSSGLGSTRPGPGQLSLSLCATGPARPVVLGYVGPEETTCLESVVDLQLTCQHAEQLEKQD